VNPRRYEDTYAESFDLPCYCVLKRSLAHHKLLRRNFRQRLKLFSEVKILTRAKSLAYLEAPQWASDQGDQIGIIFTYRESFYFA
jgi:hypothetical protein